MEDDAMGQTYRRAGLYRSFDIFGWHFSWGVQSEDSGWRDVYVGIRRLCANGLRFNVWRLFLCVAWPSSR
jgi:hypothetical protein